MGYLHLHIPFCESLCPFRSFHRVQHRHPQARRYFHSLRDGIRRHPQLLLHRIGALNQFKSDSIFNRPAVARFGLTQPMSGFSFLP
jgi:hypothetical protein